MISVADNGYDPATLKSPSTGTTTYHYLSSQASSINTAGGAAKYVLAWLAAGKPAAIDGSAQLTKLNTPTASGGYLEPNGAFHSASAGVEAANAYSQSLAVLADRSCRHRAPGARDRLAHVRAALGRRFRVRDPRHRQHTAAVLRRHRQRHQLHRDHPAGARPGRRHVGEHRRTRTTCTPRSMPMAASVSTPAARRDPDSDGTVIQALVAIGQDPTGAAWTVSRRRQPAVEHGVVRRPAQRRLQQRRRHRT